MLENYIHNGYARMLVKQSAACSLPIYDYREIEVFITTSGYGIWERISEHESGRDFSPNEPFSVEKCKLKS